jgi:diaminohydroxyphosphoribosylaminopyrimidine deaminase/5-amino-6-(5-phosphoribosylamino)uracil reductase
MSERDEQWMALAMELAERGRGRVEPNPMVGCVLVSEGQVVGQGFHEQFGGPHAEIQALADAAQRGLDPRGATAYVTLEPCCHRGKTPPCTDALIEAGIARVVVGMIDPDPNVSGRGIAKLRSAGIDVATGIAGRPIRQLLAPYIKQRSKGRPWVICKWAQTADGMLAVPGTTDRWISDSPSRRQVHELRSRCDVICVGVGTVLADDPFLTNRSGRGNQPVRLVLDARLRTPPDCHLLQTREQSPVWIAADARSADERPDQADALRQAGAEILPLPPAEDGVDLGELLDELARRGMMTLLVEGGPTVLQNIIFGDLADEMIVYIAPFAGEVEAADAPRFDVRQVEQLLGVQPRRETRSGRDTVLTYHLHPEPS